MARTLSIALDRYDRHVPFFTGQVAAPPGYELQPLEVGMDPPRRDGVNRHHRMLVKREFDIAEVSLASYILGVSRGAPFTAVPAFPRRLFSQNHIFVRRDAGIRTPADLAGKRVGLWAFQVTMSVLARGDLKADYGVPWEDIVWHTEYDEELAASYPGVRIERMPAGQTAAQWLLEGKLDAYINPHPGFAVTDSPLVKRLFDDPQAECERYLSRHGHYPIMHLLAIRRELADADPGLPAAVLAMYDDAVHQMEHYHVDPGYSTLPFNRFEAERLRSAGRFGSQLWTSGVAANRANLERFIGFMVDQRVLERPVAVDALFHPSVLQT